MLGRLPRRRSKSPPPACKYHCDPRLALAASLQELHPVSWPVAFLQDIHRPYSPMDAPAEASIPAPDFPANPNAFLRSPHQCRDCHFQNGSTPPNTNMESLSNLRSPIRVRKRPI